jgi:hypothetical protein
MTVDMKGTTRDVLLVVKSVEKLGAYSVPLKDISKVVWRVYIVAVKLDERKVALRA